jgi:hypothetical protein
MRSLILPLRVRSLLLALCSLGALAVVHASGVRPEATVAFDRYAKLTEQRLDAEIVRGQNFLWFDALSESRRLEMQHGLRDGGLIVERMETRDGGKSIDAPDALIHHWLAVVFVPGVSVTSAVALMEDYDRHSRVFAPNIAASKLLERKDDKFRVALRFYVKKVIAVTMDTENQAEFFKLPPNRAYSRIRSTKVVEIADAGTPQEHERPQGQENGFMYRLNTYWRFLERDGGTYIQCESLTLSRDVPFALGWIIKPFVSQVPKDSLAFTMGRAKAELLKQR